MQARKNVICFKNTLRRFSTAYTRFIIVCTRVVVTDVGTVMISHVLFILRDGPLNVGKEALFSLSLVIYARNIRSMSDREVQIYVQLPSSPYATCVAVCSSLMIEHVCERGETRGMVDASEGSPLTGNYEWRTPPAPVQ